jgi:uncharacterized protein YoxC
MTALNTVIIIASENGYTSTVNKANDELDKLYEQIDCLKQENRRLIKKHEQLLVYIKELEDRHGK